MVPATVYTGVLSIAIAYGAPALYPGGERAGGAQRTPSTVAAREVVYHTAVEEGPVTGVSFAVGGRVTAVEAEVAGQALDCRHLDNGRWYCPLDAPATDPGTVRVTVR